MASFPTPMVHRRSRRKLGRGQYPQVAQVGAVLTPAVADVAIVFSEPVVVSGRINLHLTRVSPAVPALLSQTQVSPTEVDQVYASTVVGCAWSLNGSDGVVRSMRGGLVASAAGTF